MTGEGPSVAGPRETAPDTASSARPLRRVFWVLVRLAIAGVLLAYLAKSGMIDARALSRPFTAWPIALVAVALILVDVSLMALRFSLLFRPLGLPIPWAKSFQLTLVSFFFAQFLPGAAGGDLAKLFYAAKDYKGRRSEIVTVSLFDRAIGMFSLLVMPWIFAPAFLRWIQATAALRALLITSAALAAAILAGFLACLYFQPLTERIARAVFGFLPGTPWPVQVIRTVASYRHNLGTVIAAFVVSVVANSLLLIVMVLAVFVLNPTGLDLKMCLIVPLGFVANSLPFTPGGLGVGEAAFNALFTVAGLTGGAEALLCWRVWTALVRLLGLVFYLRGIERVFGHHGAASHAAREAQP
jgi:glycosyltransferase 2 family protein